MDTECPNCHADWRATELIGSTRSGGGYELRCHVCGHQWDDMQASHGERAELRRIALAVEAARTPTERTVSTHGWWRPLPDSPGGDEQ